MAATQSFLIPAHAQQALIEYHKRASSITERQWNLRENMQNIDRAYVREQDQTKDNQRAKLANTYGDANKIQNITLPIIKPQVRAAVTYQAGVFLTDYPIFGVVSDPQFMDAALAMQAVLEDQSIRGTWTRELLLFFYDGFKYNLSAVEAWWDKITTPAFETDLSVDAGQTAKVKEVVWSGNFIKRWDPYNTYFDCRVEPYLIPTHGEFCGHTELMSKTALKTFINRLDGVIKENIKPAFESPSVLNVGTGGAFGASYHLPIINADALIDPNVISSEDWISWATNVTSTGRAQRINYKGLYEVSTEYVRIIPMDFGLRVPAPNTPQVWKIIIVNHSVIIYAERQTNAHDKIPVFFGCPSEDGLNYQTKSLAQDGLPFQQVGSALLNSVLAARRRAVGDRTIYDPSRITEAHMNNPSPTAKIPVRPSAYGKPVSEAVHQFPFRDDQSGITLQEIRGLNEFANVLNGQNQARQGQFVKGNKTDAQWDATMQGGTSADQLTALLYEAQVFTPLKEVLKLNILQYQGASSVYSPSQERQVNVDPVALRKAIIKFKITDGQLPTEKVISADALATGAQIIGSSPALAAGYNVAPLFSYLFKTQNANFTPFEKSQAQLAYEQALAAWQQVAMAAAQKGVEIKQPQPKPQDYGYDPEMNNPTAQGKAAVSGTSNPQPSEGAV
jgi:hypothetical protein